MKLLDNETITPSIPIPDVNEAVLRKVMEWCEHHKTEPNDDDPGSHLPRNITVSEWDVEFLPVDSKLFSGIIMASHDLLIQDLRDFCVKTVANIVGPISEEGREIMRQRGPDWVAELIRILSLERRMMLGLDTEEKVVALNARSNAGEPNADDAGTGN